MLEGLLPKTPVRAVAEVKADKRYDEKTRKLVEPDEELAVSRLKAKIIRKEIGPDDEKVIPTVTVKEFLLWDDEKNENGGRLKLFTYAGDKILSRGRPR